MTRDEALHLLKRLIDDGTLSIADVKGVRARIADEIATLEARLAQLRGYLGPRVRRSGAGNTTRRRKKSSPRLPKSQQLRVNTWG